MIITFIGLIQCLIGAYLLIRGSLSQMFLFVLVSGLLGGSAAVQLPSLGGSSIPPTQFALLFLWIRILMPSGGYAGAVVPAFRQNLALALFTAYGLVAAYAGPRIFAGTIDVAPLRFGKQSDPYFVAPLFPSSQNLTTSVYLLGSLLTAVAASIACRFKGGAEQLVKAGIWIGWIHGLTGLLGGVFKGTAVDELLGFFRNANYAQLDQSYQGFVRFSGLFPEASAWATFGYAWFIFMTECWYRGIRPRQTGVTALFLAAVLFFSTSSTAMVGLAIYFGLFIVRALAAPGASSALRLQQSVAAAGMLLLIVAVTVAISPVAMHAVVDLVDHMVLDKADSRSGLQRMFWAMQGWDAFWHSWGLGIGPGSFRSSSLVMAIMGSMGVIGLVTFLIYVINVLAPWRRSTWGSTDNLAHTLGGAAANAAIISLIPDALAAPTAVPSIAFAVFAGTALSLRWQSGELAQNPRRTMKHRTRAATQPIGN